MKIVLDTNIIWVSLSRISSSNWVFKHLLEDSYTLCLSTEIMNEYEEIISKNLSPDVFNNFLNVIDNLNNVELVTRYYSWNLINQDMDDNKFVDCAIACNADFIVTEDKHFNVLKNIDFPKVNIVNLNEFKNILL